MEDNPAADASDDADLAQGATLRMSPSRMQGLLAAGSSGVTAKLRDWQPPSVADLQRLLPQYEIKAFLARGGMGAVYQGVQRSLDRQVAIKILPPEMIEEDAANYAERFKQEARAMAKFKHPGIVTVYEAGETAEGLLYFVMEFVEGTDVAQLVAVQGRLPPEQALAITKQVCEALAYAHSRGVVHRDIKPSNVMIDADGQVKVADFGLAKMETAEGRSLTQSNVAMGTPDFVAPEALIAGTLVDQRADIYAVGVMLYQMLTGQLPRGRFAPVSTILPKSDPKLDAIVDKAMQTDRERRYSSAAELKTDVDALDFSATVPVPGRSPGRQKRTGRRVLPFAAAVIVAGSGAMFFAFRTDHSRVREVGGSAPGPAAELAGRAPLAAGKMGSKGASPPAPPVAAAGTSPRRYPVASRVEWLGPKLSAEMETAKVRGGRLRLWGNLKGLVALPSAHKELEAVDFTRVSGDGDILCALTKGGRGIGVRTVGGNQSVLFAKGGIMALIHGRHAAMVGTRPTALYIDQGGPVAFFGHPSAIQAMKHRGAIFSLSSSGEIEWVVRRGSPPGDTPIASAIPKNLVAAVGNAHGIAFLDDQGTVAFWDSREGVEVKNVPEFRDIVELDAGENHVVALRKDGRVVVSGPDRMVHTPDDLPPAVAVRAGIHCCAAQMLDGTWVAWGPDEKVNQTVRDIGPAIDLDLEATGPGRDADAARYVAWIEPVPVGGKNAADARSRSAGTSSAANPVPNPESDLENPKAAGGLDPPPIWRKVNFAGNTVYSAGKPHRIVSAEEIKHNGGLKLMDNDLWYCNSLPASGRCKMGPFD